MKNIQSICQCTMYIAQPVDDKSQSTPISATACLTLDAVLTSGHLQLTPFENGYSRWIRANSWKGSGHGYYCAGQWWWTWGFVHFTSCSWIKTRLRQIYVSQGLKRSEQVLKWMLQQVPKWTMGIREIVVFLCDCGTFYKMRQDWNLFNPSGMPEH